MKTTFAFITVILFSTQLIAQQFQRPLDPQRLSPVQDGFQFAENQIVFSSAFDSNSLAEIDNINITRLDFFDEAIWSKDYIYEFGLKNGFLTHWQQEEAILLTGYTETNLQNKVITKLNYEGEVLWSKRLGADNDINPANFGTVKSIIDNDGNIVLAGGAESFFNGDGRNDLFVGKLDTNGQLLWGKDFCLSCSADKDAIISDIMIGQNGDVVIVGSINLIGSGNQDIFILRIDENGNTISYKEYSLAVDFMNSTSIVRSIVELPNGHFILVGSVEVFTGNDKDGLIIELDTDGNFVQSNRFRLPSSTYDIQINNIEVVDADNFVISIATRENLSPVNSVENNILGLFSFANGFQWCNNYFTETVAGFLTPDDVLFKNNFNDGYIYLANDAIIFDTHFPQLILLDSNGESGCEEPIELFITQNSGYVVNEFSVEVQNALTILDYPPLVTDFQGYEINIPLIDLGPDTTFCGDFELPLSVEVNQAAEILWSTGETSAAITVNQADTIAVEVSFTNQCLILRDTMVVEVVSEVIIDSTLILCQGGTIDFFGTILDEAGDYTVVVNSDTACDTLYNLEVEIQDVLVKNFIYEGCSGDGFEIEINDVIYNESNPFGQETLTNQFGCDSVITVALDFESEINLDLGGDQLINQGESITIIPQNSPASIQSYLWSTDTAVDICENCPELTFFPV
ncbi:MAG: hypothetical protein AAGJ93_13130, partial [Bacteroidota bacterium]